MDIFGKRPELKKLNKLVKKSAAHKWYDLGIELLELEDIPKLDEIQSNYPRDAGMCCTKMLQLWLDKQPDASWSQLLQALEEVEMNELADNIRRLVLSINTGSKETSTPPVPSVPMMHPLPTPVPLEFSQEENIDNAFIRLSAAVTNIIQHTNFDCLQRACIERARSPKMLHKSNEIIPSIQGTDSFQKLCSMLSNTSYWNFLDIRIMEAMATASMIPAAQETIENFKKAFFSMTLQEAAPYFPVIKVKPSHTVLHEMLDRDPSQMTIGELHEHRFCIENEILDLGPDTCTICRIMIGSVGIVWQIHVDHVYQAYCRLNGLPSQLHLHAIRFITIPEVKRWEGLPFLWHGQDVDEIGPIESSPSVRQDPYPLPQGFEWSVLSGSNIDEILQLFIEIYDSTIISRSFYKWLISSPLYMEGCLLGIRLSSSQKLICVVTTVPYNIRVGRKILPFVNLQEEVAKNPNIKQADQISNAADKEAMRILGHKGTFQATIFTRHHVIPKSVSTFGYYIWDTRLHSLPYTTPRTVGLRRMKPSDVPKALALTNQYTSKFEIAQVFQSEEEFSHWFLSDDDIATYVVEEPNSGNITDMFSFRNVDDMRSDIKVKMKGVGVTALVITKTPAKQLITDLLVICKKQQNDHVRLPQFGLEEHLLMGYRHHEKHCIFYNYKYPEVDVENFCVFRPL